MKYVFMKASRARRAQTSKRNFTEWCSRDIWRALDGRFQLVSMWGTLRYSDVREGLKIAFLTLLLNEGAPASNDGKGRQGGERIFRGGSLPRAVCLPGGFVAASNTPAKNTHPRAAKIRSQPFQVFFWRKRQTHTRNVVQRAGKRLFPICFLTMLIHISNWNTKK